MNGRGIQKTELLNGRGPKNEAQKPEGYQNQAMNGKGSQKLRRYVPLLIKINIVSVPFMFTLT